MAISDLTVPSPSRVEWVRDSSAPEVEQVIFERSTGGGPWTLLGPAMRIGLGHRWELGGLNLPAGDLVRARGRTAGKQGNPGLIEQTVVVASPANQWRVATFGLDVGDAMISGNLAACRTFGLSRADGF